MPLHLFTTLLLITVLFTNLGCTKKEEKPKHVLDLIELYKRSGSEMGKFEEQLKKVGADEGQIIKINYEKELAKSRFERVKEQLKATSPKDFEELEKNGGGAPAGGGGHGGGH